MTSSVHHDDLAHPSGDDLRTGGATFAKPPIGIAAVESLPVAAFEREYRRARRPVVVRGLIAQRELARWSFDRIARELAELPVSTHVTRAGFMTPDPRRGVITEPRRLAEVLAQLGGLGVPSLYVIARLEELPATWRASVPEPAYCRNARWSSRKLWLAPRGTVTVLHRDAPDNVHVQLIGTKRFTVIDAARGGHVYPNGLLAGMPNGCRVSLDAPDFGRYPRFRDVQREYADLAPGDGIYIPRGMWHHVRSRSDSLSANFWWARGARVALAAGADFFKRVRGLSR